MDRKRQSTDVGRGAAALLVRLQAFIPQLGDGRDLPARLEPAYGGDLGIFGTSIRGDAFEYPLARQQTLVSVQGQH